jgi:predicted DNA-binding transcriptional regulator AlpA
MARQKPAEVSSDVVILETADLARRLGWKGEGSDTGPSPRTLERWRTTGEGPAFIKIGHRVGYRPSAAEAWLDEQTKTHTHEPSKKSRSTRRTK